MADNWIRVGHRGAPREFPANTIRGFTRAVELGCGMVECDVRQTADGILALSHDPDVTDASGRKVSVAENAYTVLMALDLGGGQCVPTLEELVAFANGKCAVMADMKCGGGDVEARVARALAPLAPEAKLVPGAGEAGRRRFREIDPALPLSLSLGHAEGERRLAGAGFESLLGRLDTGAVTWEHPLLTAERIAALHARGVKVFAWTVDDPEIMKRLVADGVDGIISNRPELCAGL